MKIVVSVLLIGMTVIGFATYMASPPPQRFELTSAPSDDSVLRVVTAVYPRHLEDGRWVLYEENDGSRHEAFVQCTVAVKVGDKIRLLRFLPEGRYFANCEPPADKTGGSSLML